MKETTTLTPEIIETPEKKEVISEVVEKKEDGEKTKDVVEETKKEFLKNSGPLSYKESKKMEEGFVNVFKDLTPEGILKTLQEEMPDIYKEEKTYEDALDVLKNGKKGDDENLELGKNENLYHWLKANVKEKKDHIEELKRQLEKEKKPIIEKVLDSTKENESIKNYIKHDLEVISDFSKKEKEREKRKEKKSESKLWKITKNVINRPLEHTWLGKYLVKKPIDGVKKRFTKK